MYGLETRFSSIWVDSSQSCGDDWSGREIGALTGPCSCCPQEQCSCGERLGTCRRTEQCLLVPGPVVDTKQERGHFHILLD